MNTEVKSRLNKSRMIRRVATAVVVTTFLTATACTITVGGEPVKMKWPGMTDCINQVVAIMNATTPQHELEQTLSDLMAYCAQKLG